MSGKSSKPGKSSSQGRERVNPLTKQVEVVPGTKAGKKRTRLPFGHPLRTHDLRPTFRRRPSTPESAEA